MIRGGGGEVFRYISTARRPFLRFDWLGIWGPYKFVAEFFGGRKILAGTFFRVEKKCALTFSMLCQTTVSGH